MLIIDSKLRQREKDKSPIKVGLVGFGAMGKGIYNQIFLHTPGMTVTAILNRSVDHIFQFLQPYSNRELIGEHDFFNLTPAVHSELEIFLKEDFDIIVEATGSVDFALNVGKKVIAAGKHLLSFNAELDATFGPLLKNLAEQAGVIYSGSDGDQPGVIMNLYRYVKQMGLKPLVCGNIKGLQDRYRTPATQKNYAKTYGLSPQMATSFADGTKISFEQSAVANATGFGVNQRGMNGFEFKGHIDEAKKFYDFESLKANGGIVDYLVGTLPAPGVFVYAYSEDPIAHHHLNYYKLGKGPLYSFYNPYHLCIFDVPTSISRVVDFADQIIVPKNGIYVEVVAMSKTDLKAGDRIDGIGGFKTYGVCENTAIARRENLLPMGLAEGAILKRAIPKDQPITVADVELKSEDLWCDYELQFSLNFV
ncbi:NAD(P)H-dependent oxidoreductase [Persicobacter psychrovividus]|uniref:StrU protein n=1 Tax=Persicobacter psychrovividus TaxID=387638 RepID=A0ABN6LEP8_9BACT|nr:strU protein [Persicobacter psychrovividus]